MESCACKKCVAACVNHPGWFAPGEAEKAAELLKMDFQEFKTKFLVLDHCDNHNASNAPYVYAPRKRTVDPEPALEPRTYDQQKRSGPCVFFDFKKERCKIHEAKPYECRVVFACKPGRWGGFRSDIEDLWIDAGAPLGMRPEVE